MSSSDAALRQQAAAYLAKSLPIASGGSSRRLKTDDRRPIAPELAGSI
jgi:hypothetical protein